MSAPLPVPPPGDLETHCGIVLLPTAPAGFALGRGGHPCPPSLPVPVLLARSSLLVGHPGLEEINLEHFGFLVGYPHLIIHQLCTSNHFKAALPMHQELVLAQGEGGGPFVLVQTPSISFFNCAEPVEPSPRLPASAELWSSIFPRSSTRYWEGLCPSVGCSS